MGNGTIVVPGSPLYRLRYAYRNGEYRAGNRVVGGVAPPPPPPPSGLGFRLMVSRSYGRSVFVPVVSPGDRSDLVAGVDRPTIAITGCTDYRLVAEGGPLVEVPNDFTVSTSGTATSPNIIRDKWFTGRLIFTGKYNTLINCYLSGNPIVTSPPCEGTNANCYGNVLQDCTIWPSNPQTDSPAYKGWQMDYVRCYVRGCTDGMAHIGRGTDGTSTGDYTGVIQGLHSHQSLYELGMYHSPDYGAAGKLPDNASHLDVGAQIRGGQQFHWIGNDIQAFIDPTIGEGGLLSVNMNDNPGGSNTHLTGNKYATPADPSLYATSAFMFSPVLGVIGDLVVDMNWLDGGSQLVNISTSHTTAGPGGWAFTNNNVGRLHRDATASRPGLLSASPSLPITIGTGNRYYYELGPVVTWPDGFKRPQRIPYSGVAVGRYEVAPDAAKRAQWAAQGIDPNNRNTWPAATNFRVSG